MADVCVILATHNRAQSLEKVIHVFKQTVKLFSGTCEFVVADNGSTDDTAAVCERQGVFRLWNETANKSAALNNAISATDSEYVVFLDDDIIVEGAWLNRMLDPLEAGGHASVARILVPKERTFPWMTEFHLALMAQTNHFDAQTGDLIGGAMAVHRRVFATVPGFDTELGGGGLGFGEDTLFSAQCKAAKMKLAFVRDAVCYHWYELSRVTREGFLERALGMGRSQAYMRYHWLHENRTLEECQQTVASYQPEIDRSQEVTQKSPQAPAPAAEIEMHRLYAMAVQWPHEMERPRLYHRHGFQKIG